MENNIAGEVELLLMDASAVEQKILDALIKLFDRNYGTLNAKRWLSQSIAHYEYNHSNEATSAPLTAYIRNEIRKMLETEIRSHIRAIVRDELNNMGSIRNTSLSPREYWR